MGAVVELPLPKGGEGIGVFMVSTLNESIFYVRYRHGIRACCVYHVHQIRLEEVDRLG